MKRQKEANGFLAIVFVVLCFNLWTESDDLQAFGPHWDHQVQIDLYHRLLPRSVSDFVNLPVALAAAAAALLGYNLWRLREGVEQLKCELEQRKTLHRDESTSTSIG